MKDEIQDIGDLFKAELENETLEPKSSGWSALQPALDKNTFMHFNIYKFNVYYMSLIILTFLFSSYTLTHTAFYNTPTVFIESDKKQESGISKNTHHIQSESDATDLNKVNILKQPAPNFIRSNNGNKNLSKSADSLEIQPATANTDNNISKQPEEIIPSKKTIEQHKVLYITKQDTVVIIDSIDSETARKRMKRNK